MKKNIAIFASGTGSNAKKIIEHFEQSEKACVRLVVSNKPDAPVLDIATSYHIPVLILERADFYQTENILKKFNNYSIDFVVLAGFLWLMPAYMVEAFEGRMLNIHPSLLPKYGGKGMYGMKVHEAVKAAGDTETGITIHYVNGQYDEGGIVFQAVCPVGPDDTPEAIAQQVHQLEHRYFPEVIERLLS